MSLSITIGVDEEISSPSFYPRWWETARALLPTVKASGQRLSPQSAHPDAVVGRGMRRSKGIDRRMVVGVVGELKYISAERNIVTLLNNGKSSECDVE